LSFTTDYARSISNNKFQDCVSPWNSLPSNDFSVVPFVSGNEFISTDVSGFASSFITSPNWIPNTYQQSTTDDARSGVVVVQSVATPLLKIPFGFTGTFSVYTESTTSGGSNKRELFFMSNRAATAFTSLGAQSAGTAPTISLTASGTYGQIISITLTGGPSGHDFLTRITLT
jgi:hypothetical protein